MHLVTHHRFWFLIEIQIYIICQKSSNHNIYMCALLYFIDGVYIAHLSSVDLSRERARILSSWRSPLLVFR